MRPIHQYGESEVSVLLPAWDAEPNHGAWHRGNQTGHGTLATILGMTSILYMAYISSDILPTISTDTDPGNHAGHGTLEAIMGMAPWQPSWAWHPSNHCEAWRPGKHHGHGTMATIMGMTPWQPWFAWHSGSYHGTWRPDKHIGHNSLAILMGMTTIMGMVPWHCTLAVITDMAPLLGLLHANVLSYARTGLEWSDANIITGIV